MIVKSGVYSSKDLAAILGSATAISRLEDRGEVVKTGRGYYNTPDIIDIMAMVMVKNKYYPDTIVSGSAALFNYRLLDYLPNQIDLDVTHESSYRIPTDMFCFYRTTKVTKPITAKFYGVETKIYPLERAVFEILKLEKTVGETARGVASKLVKNHKFDRSKLAEYAELFGPRGQELFKLILLFDESIKLY